MAHKKLNQIIVLSNIHFYENTESNLIRWPLKGNWFALPIYLEIEKIGKCFDSIIEPLDTELINPGDTVKCKMNIHGFTLKEEDIWLGEKIFVSPGPTIAIGEGEVLEILQSRIDGVSVN